MPCNDHLRFGFWPVKDTSKISFTCKLTLGSSNFSIYFFPLDLEIPLQADLGGFCILVSSQKWILLLGLCRLRFVCVFATRGGEGKHCRKSSTGVRSFTKILLVLSQAFEVVWWCFMLFLFKFELLFHKLKEYAKHTIRTPVCFTKSNMTGYTSATTRLVHQVQNSYD